MNRNTLYSYNSISTFGLYHDLQKIIVAKFIDVCKECNECIFCDHSNHSYMFCFVMKKCRLFDCRKDFHANARAYIACADDYEMYAANKTKSVNSTSPHIKYVVASQIIYIHERKGICSFDDRVQIYINLNNRKASCHVLCYNNVCMDILLISGIVVDNDGVHHNVSFDNMYEDICWCY